MRQYERVKKACDATFGTDPWVMRADLNKSRKRLFFQCETFRIKQFADVVHCQRNSN